MWNSILYSCTIHLKLNFVNSPGKNWLYLIEIQLDKIMLLSNLSLKTTETSKTAVQEEKITQIMVNEYGSEQCNTECAVT